MGDCGSVHPSPTVWPVSPEHLYCEGAPRARAKARPRIVLPFPDPSQVGSREIVWRTKGGMGTQTTMSVPRHCFLQALETPEITGHSRGQENAAWDSGSSLTLGSSLSPSLSPCPSSHCCAEPISIVRIPYPTLNRQPLPPEVS